MPTIQGRECMMDVMEVPNSVPVLIGQIPLEHLDFVVDLRARKLVGNPAHGGEHMYELFYSSPLHTENPSNEQQFSASRVDQRQ